MPTFTPLLDALKKSAQRDKEAIQRNHPHYKASLQGRPSSVQERRTQKEGRCRPRCCSEAKQSGDSTAPLGKRAAKRAAAADAAAQKASAEAGSTTQPKTGNAPLLHLWPSHHRPLQARESSGEAASTNLNHRLRHQVKPHRRRLYLRVPLQTLVPRLRPPLQLPFRLRALTVLEDGRGPCLDCRQGSSRRQQGGARNRKGEGEGKGAREGWCF